MTVCDFGSSFPYSGPGSGCAPGGVPGQIGICVWPADGCQTCACAIMHANSRGRNAAAAFTMTSLAAEFDGRAGEFAGRREIAWFGMVLAGRDHDGGFAVSLTVVVGVFDQARLLVGAAVQTGGRASDYKRAVTRAGDERFCCAAGQREHHHANCKTQGHDCFPLFEWIL